MGVRSSLRPIGAVRMSLVVTNRRSLNCECLPATCDVSAIRGRAMDRVPNAGGYLYA